MKIIKNTPLPILAKINALYSSWVIAFALYPIVAMATVNVKGIESLSEKRIVFFHPK